MSEPLAALIKWERCVNSIMDATRRFPRVLRPTLGRRLDDACIDALVKLSEARYLSLHAKEALLKEVDQALATVRVLLRLTRARDAISAGLYQHLSERVDEVGRMIGGLRRASAGGEYDPDPDLYVTSPEA